MPSAYTSKGTGRCCQRKLPPSLLTRRAAGPITAISHGLALMSAAESRLVFSGLRKTPGDCTTWEPILSGFSMSGPACRTRPLRRSIDFSLRNSRGFAYVRGQRARAAGLTVELVEKQLLRRHSDEPGP